jgi:hypothetical protein
MFFNGNIHSKLFISSQYLFLHYNEPCWLVASLVDRLLFAVKGFWALWVNSITADMIKMLI